MSEYTCPPDCCDEKDPEQPVPECAHPDWNDMYLRCVECGEPMTFQNCPPWDAR